MSLVTRAAIGIIPVYAGSTLPEDVGDRDLWGSSPHTRGAPSRASTRLVSFWDHPRIRGEHVPGRCDHAVLSGIIPAYAGNTFRAASESISLRGSSPHTRRTPRPRRLTRNPRRDHPRIRGEHVLAHHAAVLALGIIPAYAGNTWRGRPCTSRSRGSSPHTRGTLRTSRRPKMTRRDHPRIRGEHVLDVGQLARPDGIIPACAGNTGDPRGLRLLDVGSSPHARGTRARASANSSSCRDHPRMRGEHR